MFKKNDILLLFNILIFYNLLIEKQINELRFG